MAKISIIIPIYKVENYLIRCVDSVLAQSFSDYEIILVDDGSPDTCGKMCDELALQIESTKCKEVIVIHQNNGGLSAARNSGIEWAIKCSDSDWIAFIDSDDYVHIDYLKALYDSANDNKSDLAICDFVRVDNQDISIDIEHAFPAETVTDKDQLFRMSFENWRINVAWNKLYRKKEAVFRMLPAHKCFGTSNASGYRFMFWLIENTELLFFKTSLHTFNNTLFI